MKLTRTSILATSSLLIGGFIGASALVAVAANWTSAPANPPGSNVAAPINVGVGTPLLNIAGIQEKIDSLIIDGGLRVQGNVLIATGTPVAGKVLTAVDTLGTVTWAAPATGRVIQTGTYDDSGCNNSSGNVSYHITFPSPFSSAPSVVMVTRKWNTSDGSEGPKSWAFNITATGFELGYHAGQCSNFLGQNGTMWMAIQ